MSNHHVRIRRAPMALAISVALALGLASPGTRAQLFPPTANFSNLDGNNGFAVRGAPGISFSGKPVSDAGDINGDGIDDLVVGAPFSDINGYNSGSTYVVFGKAGAHDATESLSEIDGSNGFRIDGAGSRDYSGWSVSAAGDINGDGIDDLLLGAPYAMHNGGYSGSAYVVFGKSSGFEASFSLSTLNGANGFRMDGVSFDDYAGDSVSGAGDVNGDGIDDLIVGAFYADTTANYSGSAYVVYGSASPFEPALQLAALDGNNGFRIEGAIPTDWFGKSVSSAGDVNGDGIGDLIIGAPHSDGDSGYSGNSYIIFGRSLGFPASIRVSALDETTGLRLSGNSYSDESGLSVSAAGDINGDGIDDVIVGAWRADNSANSSGSSYVIFGATKFPSSSLSLSSLNGSNGFRLDGVNSFDRSGKTVSGAGDVNGDGLDDLLIGAESADADGSYAGSVFVYFGRSDAIPAVVSLGDLDGHNGMRLDGISQGDMAGRSLSAAGDVNHDGVDDFIVGAFEADTNGVRSGSGYVVFGRKDPIFDSGFE